MKNVVTFQAPKFRPMPGELTPAVINGATLPVKIGIAQRAIAACCDLSELLTWKDKLAALAAAAKMAKMPELSRDVNRVHKEAIFRMGEILLQYTATAKFVGGRGRGPEKSERRLVADSVGLSKFDFTAATRIANAPLDIRAKILADDTLPASTTRIIRHVPARKPSGRTLATDAAKLFISGKTSDHVRTGGGLLEAARILNATALDSIPLLTPEEKQRAKAFIVEMQEILDAMMQRLDLSGAA